MEGLFSLGLGTRVTVEDGLDHGPSNSLWSSRKRSVARKRGVVRPLSHLTVVPISTPTRAAKAR